MGTTRPSPAARTIAVWTPDWPVLAAAAAAGLAPAAPAAVLTGGAVVACTAGARATGVRRGLRRREAQHRCPGLTVLARDPAEEARAFEPVVRAVEAAAPGVEVIRPGLCVLPARGPSRYFGSEAAAVARLAEQASAAGPGERCRAGVAEGSFAAALAARDGALVPPGQTAGFLSTYPVEVLDRPELADLLRRLGVATLGDFALLPTADVTARFGADGALAHRLATGRDPRPPNARAVPPDLSVTIELDPPAERVDRAAFAAKALAEHLHARLGAAGLGATRLRVDTETEHGQSHTRIWRHEGVLSAAAIAERVRWQLDGWLGEAATGGPGPTGGVRILRLTPTQLVADGGTQPSLWSMSGAADAAAAERAGRAMARVQGLLGQAAVVTPVLGGGRGPGERVRHIPWGDVGDTPEAGSGHDAPWPGRLPAPAPAIVCPSPLPADLLDATGAPVRVSARHVVSAAPAWLCVDGGAGEQVLAWAGPWPVDERWWDAETARRRARFQLRTETGAWLAALDGGHWWIEGIYD